MARAAPKYRRRAGCFGVHACRGERMSHKSEPFLAWPGWKHLRFAALVSLAGMLLFLCVYGGCDAITAHRTFRVKVHFDSELAIPFVPDAVLAYMSIYPLFFAAPFVLRQQGEFLSLALALDLAIIVAGLCFLLFPAQLAFPPSDHLGAFPGLFRFADWLNLTYNLAPSLHVALSVGCIAAFAGRVSVAGKVLLWLWAVAIAFSTLLTHQHHVLDAVSGFALGLAVAPLARAVLRRSGPAKP